ncbi:DUF6506 family protein [Caulobacter mirabilis]|uniref:Hydrogenase expression protein HupH n=1 Tax=Caulobacter mirabilis TaxID=69666 RepID=A0A2D2AT41_9CAUL|nr:DUF6506 family protein [Caulobacter mirabilis]ATQ41161.1 hypothetical protein CSW64_01410 [Caulobacter mirabilis]
MITRYAFILMIPGADPVRDRIVIERDGLTSTIFPTPSADAVTRSVQLAAEDGAQLIEICGAFGPVGAAAAIEAVGGRIPIGSVSFGPESITSLAALIAT